MNKPLLAMILACLSAGASGEPPASMKTPAVSAVPLLVDRNFNGAWEMTVDAPGECETSIFSQKGKQVAGPFRVKTFQVPDVKAWSDENPAVYTVRFNGDGWSEERKFAFFTRETASGRLYINGRPVRVKAGPRELGGNAALADGDIPEDEALESGIYLLSPAELNGLEVLKALPDEGATRHLFQNWTVKAADGFQRISIGNRNSFNGTEGVSLKWTVLRDGIQKSCGFMDLMRIPPGTSAVRDMPPQAIRSLFKDGSVAVRFSFEKDGKTIADDQIDLLDAREFSPIGGDAAGCAACTSTQNGSLRLKAGETVFDFASGGTFDLSVWRKGFFKDAKIVSGMFPCVFGCATKAQPRLYPVSAVNEKAGALSFHALVDATCVDADGNETALPVYTSWTMHPNGRLECDFDFRGSGKGLRRGVGIFVAPGQEIEWYGLGPWSTTPSYREGAFSGRWKTKPSGDLTLEEVRGIKIGDFTLRTLQEPLSVAVVSGEAGPLLLVFPGKNAKAKLSFAISPGDGNLAALAP